MKLSRRHLLQLAAATAPALAASGCSSTGNEDDAGWNRGRLTHLLPTASANAFNLKVSFQAPLAATPLLSIADGTGKRRVEGVQGDELGRFWAFRVSGLSSDREYSLTLHSGGAGDTPLCDSWPLRTLPASDAKPDRLRIGAFTCAGGMSLPISPSLFEPFKPVAYRRHLFDRLLSEEPDLVVANGDHVYFDLPMSERIQSHALAPIFGPFLSNAMANFDPSKPVRSPRNESALTTVGDDQIASIYGVRFRSTPVFFITDDHDYFDNDDATKERVSFPPNAFHRELRNHLQRLYFPEFLSPSDAEAALPGRVDEDGIALSTHFGSVRYGDLFAGLFYDCGGYLELGAGAGLVPSAVEEWLIAETRREDTLHAAHFPSHPMGWTAGKWREWYRDRLESKGSVVAAVGVDEDGGKYMWQSGWWEQHQRLLNAMSSQRSRAALTLSGDLHALGAGSIEASGSVSLAHNPVRTILTGPVGVGEIGWPSRARGVTAQIPRELSMRTLLDLEERNGFTVIDFDRERTLVRTLGCPAEYREPGSFEFDEALRAEWAISELTTGSKEVA